MDEFFFSLSLVIIMFFLISLTVYYKPKSRKDKIVEAKGDLSYQFGSLKVSAFNASIFLISFISLATYAILLVIKFTLTPPLFPIGSIDSWIGFSGSVLGGCLTVLALIITINNQKIIIDQEKIERLNDKLEQEKKYQEEKSWSLMPIIEISPLLPNVEIKNLHDYCNFKVENISNNHVRDFEIENVSFSWKDANRDNILVYKVSYSTEEIKNKFSLVPAKTERVINLDPSIYDEIEQNKNIVYDHIVCEVDINIKFHDIMKSTPKYTQNFRMTLAQKIVDKFPFTYFDYISDYSLKEYFNNLDI